MASLVQLTQDNVEKLNNNKIYLIDYFEDMYREMYDTFPELKPFDGIFDNRVRNRGLRSYNGTSYDIKEFDRIRELAEPAVFIIVSGYYEDDYAELQRYDIPDIVDQTVYYYANKNTFIYKGYLEKYMETPLENIVVFRSGPGSAEYAKGTDYSDNSRALFEHMISNGYDRKWEMVWLVKYPEEFTSESVKYPGVDFISYDWAESEDADKQDRYYRVICLAKFFFFTDACAFCRYPREGQVRVQLWHGCGYKKRKQNDICANKYEYMPVSSEVYADIHSKVFGLGDGQMMITGYPKQDWVFHPIADWHERLGVPYVDKYIFWLPTYRKVNGRGSDMSSDTLNTGTGLPIIDTEDELVEMNEYLRSNDIVLFIKLHPIQSAEDIKVRELSNIVIMDNKAFSEASIHVNSIMAYASGLLCDYSSAIVDYLLLDRPIGVTTDDLENYQKERGFVFDNINDWLPGIIITKFDELIDFIGKVCAGEDPGCEIRHRISGKMNKYRDDGSCERILDRLGVTR